MFHIYSHTTEKFIMKPDEIREKIADVIHGPIRDTDMIEVGGL